MFRLFTQQLQRKTGSRFFSTRWQLPSNPDDRSFILGATGGGLLGFGGSTYMVAVNPTKPYDREMRTITAMTAIPFGTFIGAWIGLMLATPVGMGVAGISLLGGTGIYTYDRYKGRI